MLQHQDRKTPQRYRDPKNIGEQIGPEELLATLSADQGTNDTSCKRDQSDGQRSPAKTFHIESSSFDALDHLVPSCPPAALLSGFLSSSLRLSAGTSAT